MIFSIGMYFDTIRVVENSVHTINIQCSQFQRKELENRICQWENKANERR